MTHAPDTRIAVADCDAIIVNYNAGDSLRDAVTSALAAGVDHVLVVDNGSRDDSLVAVRALTATHPVRILQNGRNLGFAAACNVGLAESRAAQVLFLNPDARLGTGALERLQDVLASDPTIGMVGGRLCDPDGTEQRGSRRRFPTPERTLAEWRGAGGFQLHDTPLPEGPVDVEAISGACMLVARPAIEACGGWDEGYFLHCEDLDWCRQFAARGWRVVFVPDALVFHEKGVSSRARPLLVEWHKHRGMQRFFGKWQARERAWPVRVAVRVGIWTRFAVVALRELLGRLTGARRTDG